MQILLRLSFYLKQDGVESGLETSHRGGHRLDYRADRASAVRKGPTA